MSDNKGYTVLDGTNPTLDASNLSYEFEKARINGATNEDVDSLYFEEEYKIKMWQWSASILQATANIAQGVSKAIAQGGVAGLVTGALVAAAGGVQIASIVANKPIPPHFAHGGFVGGMHGATMGADDTTIFARSGEMIANAAQQRNLWEAMNGKGGHGKGTNILVSNNASNIVNAEPRISQGQIELLIDARINEGLKDGRYSNALKAAENGMSGDFYGI